MSVVRGGLCAWCLFDQPAKLYRYLADCFNRDDGFIQFNHPPSSSSRHSWICKWIHSCSCERECAYDMQKNDLVAFYWRNGIYSTRSTEWNSFEMVTSGLRSYHQKGKVALNPPPPSAVQTHSFSISVGVHFVLVKQLVFSSLPPPPSISREIQFRLLTLPGF